MIHVTRLSEPAILTEKKETWLKAFLRKRKENPKQRPSSTQYAHPRVKDVLAAMSMNKCYYCERKLVESEQQVDHYIEVAEKPELAFEWRNLYLSCDLCNRRKIANLVISVNNCVDPCDSSDKPEDHLAFDNEYIKPKCGSAKGKQTIKKYKLDRGDLDLLRTKKIKEFEKTLRQLRERQIKEGRTELNRREAELLLGFTRTESAFSLMFRTYLEELNLQ